MNEYDVRTKKILSRIHELAAISEDQGGITRTFGTQAFRAGQGQILRWMQRAGLDVRIDSIGNVRGRINCKKPGTKTFVIGSHIDTVVNAGRFDGPLGVIMGLDLLENHPVSKEELPFSIELIAFSDEEGVRFHTTYLGSKVVAGTFDQTLLQKKDAAGVTLQEVLKEMGCDPGRIARDAMPKDEWLGYLEMHIEQGPVLWERHIPVAPVTAIAGQNRVELVFTGMAGHAGTVPMNMRQDALAAAAEFVLATEAFARNHGRGLVATVGKLNVNGSASNVIPGEVACSLDLRSPDAAQLDAACQSLQTKAEAIAAGRNLRMAWNLIQKTAPVACDAGLNLLLNQAITDSGFELIPLVSGAGHDAVPISQVSPATMMFIRDYKGISHNPLENAEPADIAAAVQVADRFLSLLIAQNSSKHQKTRPL